MQNEEPKCSTICFFHDERSKDIANIHCVLNGEHGNVGLVGKVNTMAEIQKTILEKLSGIEGRFWKLTLMMLGGIALAALNLFLLLVKRGG